MTPRKTSRPMFKETCISCGHRADCGKPDPGTNWNSDNATKETQGTTLEGLLHENLNRKKMGS